MKNKKCECWSCQLTPKIKKLDASLTEEQRTAFREILDTVGLHEEASSTDLAVIQSKINGSWPREDGEKYYERVGTKLYEVHGVEISDC